MENHRRNPNTKCSICDKEIYRRPFQLKESSAVFCGKICYGKSRRKETGCKICDKPILSSLNKLTCSKECYDVYRNQLNKEHNWGRKPRSNDEVNTKQARQKFIKERGNKCELCAYNIAEILNVHHIIERCNGGTNEKSNLIVICPNCHAEIHAGIKILKMESPAFGAPSSLENCGP